MSLEYQDTRMIQGDARKYLFISPWEGLLWCMIIGLAMALQIYTSRYGYNPDSFTYPIMAQEMLRGKTLYTEVLCDKPPIAIWINVLVELIWPRSYIALKMTLGLCLLIQAIGIIWVMRPSFWGRIGILSFLMFYPLTHWDWDWLSTEHLSNLWVVGQLLLAYVILERKKIGNSHAFLAGVLAGLAVMTRPTTLPVAFLPLGCLLWRGASGRIKAQWLGWMVLGGLVVMAGIFGIVFLCGDVRRFLFVLFVYPFMYFHASDSGGFIDLLRLLDCSSLLLLVMILVAACWSARLRILGIGAVIVCAAAAVCSPRPFVHYWEVLFPAMALLLAIVLAKDRPVEQRRLIAPMLGAVLAGILVLEVWKYVEPVTRNPILHKLDITVKAIGEVSRPGDTLAAFGPISSEYIVFASSVPPSDRMRTLWELDNGLLGGLAGPEQELVEEFLKTPPSLLVLESELHEKIQHASMEFGKTEHGAKYSEQLLRRLRDEIGYQIVSRTKHFVILRCKSPDKRRDESK